MVYSSTEVLRLPSQAVSIVCMVGTGMALRRMLSGASTLVTLGPQSGNASRVIMFGASWLPVEMTLSSTRENGRNTSFADCMPCLIATSRMIITRPPGELLKGQRAAQGEHWAQDQIFSCIAS